MHSDRDYYSPTGFGGFSFFPPVIKNLLIINAAVFLIQSVLNNYSIDGVPGFYIINRYFALNPIDGVDQIGNPSNFQVWQLFTYQFMHGSFTHILFNMLMLWMFGMEIENMWGSKKFLVYYLTCGVGAGLAHIFLSPVLMGGVSAPTIGASGSIFGVLIAFAMFFPNRYIYIYFLLPIKAKYLITLMVMFEFMSVGAESFVAHLAHLGGAVVGLVFILIDRRKSLNFNNFINSFKKNPSNSSRAQFRKKPSNSENGIEDAQFYDINKKSDDNQVTQEEIDRILDKISQSGYQNLSDHEKKVLFEASKKN
jgi:membrane associated rhomboid family serine protease